MHFKKIKIITLKLQNSPNGIEETPKGDRPLHNFRDEEGEHSECRPIHAFAPYKIFLFFF